MGNNPDYAGEGIAVWINKAKDGTVYATVQLFGSKGIRVNCFPYQPKDKFVREYVARTS